ncbi:MAG: M28 family peptidase [Phycisphaerae bacterium]|jgi:hypothetical protein|nr:M28 family peptidase [Phycisphaerae bacterium]
MRRCSLIRLVVGLSLVQLSFAQLLASAKAPLPAGPKSAVLRAEEAMYGRYVRVLASDKMGGRAPSTPGARHARTYLVAQLRKLGLKPAFGGNYHQPFTLSLGTKTQSQQLRAIRADKRIAELRGGRDFNALGFSASRTFSGPAVFVGYAITDKPRKYDNFAGLKKDALKGKVAVAFRYEPHDPTGKSRWTKKSGRWSNSAGLAAKTIAASRHGASALLIVNPPALSNMPLLTTRSSGFRRQSLPVLHVSTAGFKRILTHAKLDADAVIGRLQARANDGTECVRDIPGLNLSGQVNLKSVKGTTYNIAATLPGRGNLADQAIIVGAHWDHLGRRTKSRGYFPGANDNASGTSGILILAKRFTARAKTNTSQHRRRVVLALFGAEERGLLGSSYMAGHLKELGLKLSQVTAMVNMDLIGRLKNNRVGVWRVGSGNDWEQLVRSAAEGSGVALAVSRAGKNPSDHESFYRRKIPAICFSTGGYPDLHRQSDTADKIDSAGAIRILGIVDRLVETLA